MIAAEDTRRTAALLSAIGVSRTLISLHEHNEGERIEGLVRELQSGKVVVLVSDAGTPRDKSWPSVDVAVPDLARLLVVSVARAYQRAA